MIIIHVCIGSACHLKGSYNVITKLQSSIEERDLKDNIEVKAAFCLGECTKAVAVKVNNGPVFSLNQDNVDEFLDNIVNGRF